MHRHRERLPGGFLEMDASIGGSLTIGALTLQAGSHVTENALADAFELADVTGWLTLVSTGTTGVQMSFAGQYAPFQVLLDYGSLSGLGNLIPPNGVQLTNDIVAKTIDLARA